VSLRADGSRRCDRCGADLGNGGIDLCARITDLEPDDPTQLRYLELCRQPREGAPRGCVGNVLGPGTLANYYETRNA
jgi:ribosomal protein S14